MKISLAASSATAPAVRGRPSMTAISPKVSPGSMMLRNTSRPSGLAVLIRTRPETTP